MKKYLCFVLSFVLLLCFAGCNHSGNEKETTVPGTVLGPGATAAELVDSDLAEKIGVSSEKYEIDNAMVAFFLYDIYRQFVSENHYYLSYYGLDITKSLKEQSFDHGDEETWFDYFLGLAKEQIKEMLALISISETTELMGFYREAVDAYLSDVRDYAEENDYPTVDHYYATAYVSGVTEEVARRCVEMSYLASQCYEELYNSFSYTVEEYEAYVVENLAQFYIFDYVYYSFSAKYATDATEDEKTAAYDQCKADANALAEKIRTEGVNEALIAQIMTDNDCDRETAESKLASSYTKSDGYIDENNEFLLWALDEERAIGDVGVAWDEKHQMATVYLLQSKGERPEYLTKNVRHILFTPNTYGAKESAKTEAERLLALYEAGEKTEEAFGLLAGEYTEDSNGDVGGLYENVPRGMMVSEFENWIYDESRAEGDVGIVETSYGYHIMYFAGDGLEAWKAEADEALRSSDTEEAFEVLLEEFAVVFHEEILKEIP